MQPTALGRSPAQQGAARMSDIVHPSNVRSSSRSSASNTPNSHSRADLTRQAFGPEAHATDSTDFSVAASLDEGQTHSLGYKDELELRFIWDRVLGKGKRGTVVRAVVDRFTGQEFACRCMPKSPPPGAAGSAERDEDAARLHQLAAIKREIMLFTRLHSSLNVAHLEHIYEDDTHVYLVEELCEGPTLMEAAEQRSHSEHDIAYYVRSVVKTIAQCHDQGTNHGAVSADNFMLLSEDRRSPLKCVSFGPDAAHGNAMKRSRSGSIFERIGTMAPEMFARAPSLGKHADMWAAGLMSARLLTGYFPFDDIVENAIDNAGVLQHVGPVMDFINDNPLMPSGAALFVSAVVMLLDFSRPHWQPVSNQAKDFVVQCLNWRPQQRLTALRALAHPWLSRFSAPGTSEAKRKDLHAGVVQRIQRFGGFSHIKRAALENIAEQLVVQQQQAANALRSMDGGSLRQPPPRSASSGALPKAVSSDDIASHASDGSLATCSPFVAQRPDLDVADEAWPPGTEVYHGLLEHLVVHDGVVNKLSLQRGLQDLGYQVDDASLDHLLEQLSAVPGVGGNCVITNSSLAASQVDWEKVQEANEDAWRQMARSAFDALDLDGGGRIEREELADMLAGRLPEQEVQEAIEQAMLDAGQDPSAPGIDFDAFLQLLKPSSAPEVTNPTLSKFASLRPVHSAADRSLTGSLAAALRRACTFRLQTELSLTPGQVSALQSDPRCGSMPDGATARGSGVPTCSSTGSNVANPPDMCPLPSAGAALAADANNDSLAGDRSIDPLFNAPVPDMGNSSVNNAMNGDAQAVCLLNGSDAIECPADCPAPHALSLRRRSSSLLEQVAALSVASGTGGTSTAQASCEPAEAASFTTSEQQSGAHLVGPTKLHAAQLEQQGPTLPDRCSAVQVEPDVAGGGAVPPRKGDRGSGSGGDEGDDSSRVAHWRPAAQIVERIAHRSGSSQVQALQLA